MFDIEAMDLATIRDALRGPGMDTRQWGSYGVVVSNTDDSRSVRFASPDGAPLPHGVLVDVKLEPSGIVVPCRVGMAAAGSGEAEYSPFGPGDEVFVLIPQGDERAGCVIACRLPNALDVFPTTVAGIDTTNNSVSFKRIKTPYVLETGASYLVRSALTGSQIALDAGGGVFLSSGDKHVLALTPSLLMLQTGDAGASLQIDPGAHTVALQADQTSLFLDSNASKLITPGTLMLGTSGIQPAQHAITLEQVVNLLVNYTLFLHQTGVMGLDSILPAGPVSTAFDAKFSLILAGAALLTPPTINVIASADVPGGNLTLLPLTQAAIATALAIPILHGPEFPVPIPEPYAPGIGRVGLTL